MKVGGAALALLALFGAPVLAADLSADVQAAAFDLASPEALAKAGLSSALAPRSQRALDYLRADKVLPAGRISTLKAPPMLEAWSKALVMGTRGKQFATDIARIRDLAKEGSLDERHDAINALYRKAGRSVPDSALMATIDKQIGQLVGERAESVRYKVDAPDHTTEVGYAKGAGEAEVEVTDKSGAAPVRTVVRGEEKTQPTADGNDIETTLVPTAVCVIDQKESEKLRAQLTGTFKGSDGSEWTLGGSGTSFTATEKRPGGHTLVYDGSYSLGKATAFHGIVSIDDIKDDLPAGVRSQLIGWSPKVGFTVRLELCASTGLKGTWSSQYVTYGAIDGNVRSVHDPYDVPLFLSRGLRVAQGGRNPEEGP